MAARPDPASLQRCQIIGNRPVGAYRLLSFVSRDIAAAARPGQFLMVRSASEALDPLLPRPLGIHDIDSDVINLLMEPVGKATKLLAELGVGDEIEALGPLGHGFDIMSTIPAVIVGGGIGVAPLKFLARSLVQKGRQVRCILGFKNSEQAAAANLFREFDPEILTEDGVRGSKGMVSEPLPGCLAPVGKMSAVPEVFACGPGAMLRSVADIGRACGGRVQVSVATHMACGIGACQGCAIEAVGGYALACSDGPVFDSIKLKWR